VSSAYTNNGVLLGNRRIAVVSGGRFLAHVSPTRAAHPHDGERLGVVLMVHLRLRAGAGDTGQTLDLAALEVDLSVAAAGALCPLLLRQRIVLPVLAHRVGMARQAVVLVEASGRKALA